MGMIELLKANENFTETEQKIAQYTLNNMLKVSRLTIKEFSTLADVSEASIVRFCKQLGVKGFRDFKLELNRELALKKDNKFNLVHKNNINELSTQDIFFNTLELDRIAVERLISTLDIKNVEKALDTILENQKVVVYGSGASAIVAEDITHKFTKLGIHVVYNRDFHFMLSVVVNMKPGDTFIAVSTTGETQEVNNLVQLAKEHGVVIISITSLQKSLLTKQTDIPLYTPILEESFRIGNMATRISQLVVVDVLYMNLYGRLSDEVTDKLYDLRDSVERYR